jgi:hypothetical protein
VRQRLELGERLAELLAVLGVLHRDVERVLTATVGACAAARIIPSTIADSQVAQPVPAARPAVGRS